jgi:exosortase/archaeosortase family protein
MRPAPGIARFALRFLVVFVVLTGGFEALRGGGAERFVVDDLFVGPATAVVNALVPAEHARAQPRAIESDHARLRVLRGCEGVETVFLVLAAVLAFPAGWRARALGAVGGTALAYLLSVARLALLFLGLRFWPAGFALTHGVVLPLMPVALLALYFLSWSGRAARAANTPA